MFDYTLKELIAIAKDQDTIPSPAQLTAYTISYACRKLKFTKKQQDDFFNCCNEFVKMVADSHPAKPKGVRNGHKRTV